jgi:uncharacterized protein (UPF0305 family)
VTSETVNPIRSHNINPTKYKSKKVELDGKVFSSKREAARYQQLKILEKAGQITSLVTQEKYRIFVRNMPVCVYIADFVYNEKNSEGDWCRIVEDVKGMKTPVYQLKKKLMKAALDIEIRET